MRTNNPNNRESSSYTGWIIGGVLAVVAVLAIATYSGNDNVASNDTPAATTGSATTGSGSATTGSGSANDSNTRTPLPAGPRR